MYRINDQTVLEEDYDEDYQPTEEGPYSLIFILQDHFVDRLL